MRSGKNRLAPCLNSELTAVALRLPVERNSALAPLLFLYSLAPADALLKVPAAAAAAIVRDLRVMITKVVASATKWGAPAPRYR